MRDAWRRAWWRACRRILWRHGLGTVGLAAVGILALAGCGGGGSAGLNCASNDAMVCTKTIQVDGADRTVLATHDGKTLYAYKPDTSTSVVCTGGCALAWPPLTTSGDVAANLDGLSGTLSILSAGNGRQVLYNGHPLYTYALDGGIGDARGQGQEGGNWSVVMPDVTPLGAPPSAAPTPTDASIPGY